MPAADELERSLASGGASASEIAHALSETYTGLWREHAIWTALLTRVPRRWIEETTQSVTQRGIERLERLIPGAAEARRTKAFVALSAARGMAETVLLYGDDALPADQAHDEMTELLRRYLVA